MTIFKHEQTTIRKGCDFLCFKTISFVFCDIIAPRVSGSNTIIYIFDMTILEHKEDNDKKKDERRIRNFQKNYDMYYLCNMCMLDFKIFIFKRV